jgi:hypothetical protein
MNEKDIFKYINFNDCIVNLACSIKKYFWLNYTNNTLKDVDKLLETRQPKNVVVILYDWMWYNLIKRIIPNNFLDNHITRSFSSVVPATTTASTTSMLTWMYPKEHWLLWWNLYIKPTNQIVTLFTNELKDTEIQAQEYNIIQKYFPFKNIPDEINENWKYQWLYISPFWNIKYETLDEMLNEIKYYCDKDWKKYIYAYHDEPDHTLHEFWTDSKEVKEKFETINNKTEEFCKTLDNDTLIIIVADHWHINCDWILLDDYKDFKDTLDWDTWLEWRLCSFKVKDEKNFKKLFKKYFSQYFKLYSKEEVINMNLFWLWNEHNLFKNSLWDYFALWFSNKYFRYSENSSESKSHHAWFTEDEMLIPLIIYYNN